MTFPDAGFDDDRELVLRAIGKSWSAPPAPPLPAAPIPAKELIRRFLRAAAANAATAERLPDKDAIPHAVARHLRALRAPPKLICSPEWRRLNWRAAGIAAECRAPKEADAAGLTGVAAAAADCGAMLVRGNNPHQLTASLLPRHHIAAVSAANIAPTLNEMFALPQSRPPGVAALFCGPSRTADIEQTLVLGMHGPLSVHVLVV